MVAAVSPDVRERLPGAVLDAVEVRVLGPGPLEAGVLDGVGFLVPDHAPDDVLDLLDGLQALRVVQVLSAGTDWIEDRVPPWATLCNARGARDVPVAEWVLGALLGAQARLLEAARDRTWTDRRAAELAGSTVLVLGAGSIGEAVRARLAPFDVDVVAVARRAREGVHAAEELPGLLTGADALVVLAPLTGATRGLVGAELLARLPDGALVVNAGRGGVVDTEALLAELESGRLRAVLDVVDPEPLPARHPLWRAPGTLAITPHHAGDSPQADARAAVFAAEQLARRARGEPLLNVVAAGAR